MPYLIDDDDASPANSEATLMSTFFSDSEYLDLESAVAVVVVVASAVDAAHIELLLLMLALTVLMLLMLLPLPSPALLHGAADGAIVVDLTVHVVLSAAVACLSSVALADAWTIASSCFGSCAPLALTDTAAAADADGVAIVVVAVAATAVVAVVASTLFTDDLLYNWNINKQAKKNNEHIKWIYRTIWS